MYHTSQDFCDDLYVIISGQFFQHIFHSMISQTDLSASEGQTVCPLPPSDQQNLQYDSSLMLLKVSFIFEECYEHDI